MKRVGVFVLFVLLLSSAFIGSAFAQNDFAAKLEVLDEGVDVQRVNTAARIGVNIEAVVGVGDTIFTGNGARARIHFFDDGSNVTLEPNTIYRIDEFRRAGRDGFILRTSVLLGNTVQDLQRVLDADSAYIVHTPSMDLEAHGTVFAVRVENSSRSGTVVREGTVAASNTGSTGAEVRAGFGVRAVPGNKLSDVVQVDTFSQLDSFLDGCNISMSTADDVSLNVRLAPSLDAARISFIPASAITRAIGTVEGTTWYRIQFADNFAWVLSSNAEIQGACAGLRLFAADHVEDASLYNPDSTDMPLILDMS